MNECLRWCYCNGIIFDVRDEVDRMYESDIKLLLDGSFMCLVLE